MELSDDAKVGIALLEEVDQRIKELYGNTAALAPGSEYDPVFDVDNKQLLQQLDLAERKIGKFRDGQAYLNLLRGRLWAIKLSPVSNRPMLKCGDYYQKAIDLGYEEEVVRFYWGLHHRMWNKKEKAIEQFERVVNRVGVDSELGLEAAKEIEKLKAKKGGCFVATAIYGSEMVPEVILLRSFRDNSLMRSVIGRSMVSAYYRFSPPLARFIGQKPLLRCLAKSCFVEPFVRWCRSRERRESRAR